MKRVKSYFSQKPKANPKFGQIRNASQLGALIRSFRKNQHLTLEKVSGLSNLSMRFISELERGKETAELGKTLDLMNKLGLEVVIQPRGTEQSKRIHIDT